MRSLRWLLLVAIVAMAVAIFGIYQSHKKIARASARPTPPMVPLGTLGEAVDFEWAQSQDGKPAVKVHADNSRQTDGNTTELDKVELRIYTKDGKRFDRVRSPKAQLSQTDSRLFAPGEAEITLNIPAEGAPPKALTTIRAAAINFDTQSGQAVTESPVSFTFDGGEGTCRGATYNPQTHELHLEHDVDLRLKGRDPAAKVMRVEAGELVYVEKDGVVRLGPWSRLTRDQTTMSAAESIVHLRNKKLDFITAAKASGADKQPGRDLEFAADELHVQYNEDRLIEKLNGVGNAKLVSRGPGSTTTMTGDSVDLAFNTQTGESELASALARGHGSVESVPVNDPKGLTADTKILKSENIDLFMKPGGRDLDRVVTHTPGSIEFLPHQAARHHRILKASEMDIRYGARSEIQSFHGLNASTQTDPSDEERRAKKANLAVLNTTSKMLDVTFDDKAQVRLLKQSGDFRYVEGSRKAQADSATLDGESNAMDLEAHARISDDTGSTSGDHIHLDQNTGDFDARGHVATTRLADDKKTTSDMLDKSQATQGLADHVTSANRNRLIHYIGNAVLWQASNRIQADRIDIDRDRRSLVADGQVISQFEDKSDSKSKTQSTFTIVKAPHLVYTDSDRQAVYSGGADFSRPGMTVKCVTLKAFLNGDDSDADSRINRAFGDGAVRITHTGAGRQRIGSGEHTEYYSEDGRIVLFGGEPQLQDTLRGNTRGGKLTYYTDDDRLVVDGAERAPVRTELRKGKR
jgi:lipopolysaccharide export system protein LptA